MLMQPWQHRKGTSERGDDWEKLAVSLNAIPNPQFHVTQRSVRDHYSTMEKRRRKKSGKKTEPQVLLPKRKRNWISYLMKSWNSLMNQTKQ